MKDSTVKLRNKISMENEMNQFYYHFLVFSDHQESDALIGIGNLSSILLSSESTVRKEISVEAFKLTVTEKLGFKIEIIQIQKPILYYSDSQEFGLGNKKMFPGTIFFCNWDCFDHHLHLGDQHCSWSKFELDRRGKSILIAVLRVFGQAGL